MLDIYGAAAGGLLANGLAFSALFASIPTTLLIVGVAGWLTNDTAVRAAVVDLLSTTFPPLAELIDESLTALSHGAAFTSILGILGLVWTVSQLYGALDVAFARIYSTDPERDIVNRTARGLLVVGILVVGIVGLIVISTIGAALDALHPADVPIGGSLAGWLGSIPVLIALSIAGVLVVYRTLPPRAPSWRAAARPGRCHRSDHHRAQPDLHVPGPPAGRGGGPGRLAGLGLHRAGLAVVHVPGPALWRGVGPRPRPERARGVSRPGGSRSACRTGRCRRVTARS